MNLPKTTRRDPGFALVVTLSLMILLTVIAVGMLTLATITLRSTSTGDAAEQARSNARLALMLAIGELQREMGPDSRISAPHDVGGATGGQPHWTAVYDAWQRPATGTDSPDTRSPTFRGWLTSGANAATGGPVGTADKVQLFGPGSLGGTTTPLDEVSVPMHEVKVGQKRGRIAWWTADEGMKAKVNAGPEPLASSSFGISDSLFNNQAPPNIGQRAIPPLSAMEWKPGHRAISVSNSQLTLAAGLARGGLGKSIHDVTVHSAGVLADVRSGRLKRDLGNLLSRPLTQSSNMPLYLADGRMNNFTIGADGAVSNSSVVKAWSQAYNSADQWGINLEELHLFHNLHRELNWTGSRPSLVSKNSREAVVSDPYYMYRRPTVQGLQFIFSLSAIQDPKAAAGRYKMQMNLDALVVLSNPNDIPLQYPPGLVLPFQLLNLPYSMNWKIQRPNGTMVSTTSTVGNFNVFKGHVEGGTAGAPAVGFTLEPGEAAVYGSSTATNFDLNLRRGFEPTGGVKLTGWELNATNLEPEASVNFQMTRIAKTTSANAWTYYNAWIGPRPNNGGWQMDSAALFGGSLSAAMNDYLPPVVEPPQSRPVSDFINKPQPVMMLSFLQNVEQAYTTAPPDAFASRPFLLNEPALTERSMNPDRFQTDRHATQMLITAEPMNYEYRATVAAGMNGRNAYIGGGRQPSLGGSFNVVSRRIPLAPPLSLGAFQNAVASGFSDHFNESDIRFQVGGNRLCITADSFPSSAIALSGHIHALPLVSQAIGNSHSIPHLKADQVFSQNNNTTAARGTVGKVATDHSWMANTALWDSWFLSSIVSGTGTANTPWMKDPRSARAQFTDLVEGKHTLRNKRYVFNPSKTPEEAMKELFSGDSFKNSAINQLSKYLLADGAFNVNSTSKDAWAALLSSVRDQTLLTKTGGTQSFSHPFGTLGHATSTATSGTEGDWSGLRDLDEADIKDLADAIVKQVKDRGPFLSLADFVNRRPNSSDPVHQTLGALQAAIDTSGLNDRFASGSRRSNPGDFAPIAGSGDIAKEPEPARAIGSPGHLSQGDLLTAIGSQITVRSDTFIIRTYGDARDKSNKILSTAWCEAVIQRVPEYIDPTDVPEAQTGWPQPSSTLTPANTRFGRRLVVGSFRWLSREEI
jgi:hypothetical protein